MSRSYKKLGYAGDRKGKYSKNQANRRIRRKWEDEDELPQNGNSYKKYYPQWDICDFYTLMTEREWLEDWDNPDSWQRREFKTKEESLNYYRKCYKRK